MGFEKSRFLRYWRNISDEAKEYFVTLLMFGTEEDKKFLEEQVRGFDKMFYLGEKINK